VGVFDSPGHNVEGHQGPVRLATRLRDDGATFQMQWNTPSLTGPCCGGRRRGDGFAAGDPPRQSAL